MDRHILSYCATSAYHTSTLAGQRRSCPHCNSPRGKDPLGIAQQYSLKDILEVIADMWGVRLVSTSRLPAELPSQTVSTNLDYCSASVEVGNILESSESDNGDQRRPERLKSVLCRPLDASILALTLPAAFATPHQRMFTQGYLIETSTSSPVLTTNHTSASKTTWSKVEGW